LPILFLGIKTSVNDAVEVPIPEVMAKDFELTMPSKKQGRIGLSTISDLHD
jgi:hypothetical protein